MPHKRPDGTYQISASIGPELASRIEALVETDLELTQAELVRCGLRKELKAREEQ